MTDESDDARPDDATADTDLPDAIVQLGIEAQAEYRRARQRLGLSDGPVVQLGTVGRYRLEREIGRGGMGIVYRARDPELDRQIAIKLVQTHPFAHHDKLRARLLREAKILARLTHSNVVRVYDCGQHDGEVYLAMEYVEGETLRRWQRGQTHRSILDAYAQAARGLAAAHDLGITHRDFKPDNVLVATDGRVLVGDFGLAGLSAGEEIRVDGSSAGSTGGRGATTQTGALLGTLTYMAPEQLRGEVATPRSDQFAFCVSLWEALAGRRPFEGEQQDALLEQIEQSKAAGTERIPRRLRARLLRGLAEDPEARFAHVRDLADAIQPRRSRVVVGAVLLLTLSVGLLVGWLLVESPRCDLPASLASVKEMSQWTTLQDQLSGDLRPVHERLRGYVNDLEDEVEEVCARGVDSAEHQELEGRIAYLRGILEASPWSEEEVPALLVAIDGLEDEYWRARPPRPLDEGVNEQLELARVHMAKNELEGALDAVKQAVDIAGARDLELELAHAHLVRGRILTLLGGRYTDAMEAYEEALVHADVASDDSTRLELELLIAEVAVMRLGDMDRAQYSLHHALGPLGRVKEPWLSLRRANRHEIQASILKRRGDFDGALSHQRHAMLHRYLRLDFREIGNGHVNLGTIHEWRDEEGDSELARLHYEYGLRVLESASLQHSPEWFEAAYNLGHWLVNNAPVEDSDYAERLLQVVRSESDDLRLFALTDLVLLALSNEEDAEAMSWAWELDESLRDAPLDLEEKRLDAWSAVAVGYAVGQDLEAFEDARDRFLRIVHGDPDTKSDLDAKMNDLKMQSAALDLQAAQELEEYAPTRARELAESARANLLELPPDDRPEDMLEEIDRLTL